MRIRELLEERRDLHAAEVVYSLFHRLESGERGRPNKIMVSWDFIEYVVNHFL